MDFRHIGTIARSDRSGQLIGGELRGVAAGPADRIFVAADCHVCVLSDDGQVIERWNIDREPLCIAVTSDGMVCVGELCQIEIFDATGRLLERWSDRDRLQFPSAIAIAGDSVYVSDVNRRSILRYDRCGKFLTEIGKNNTTGGFIIPNGRLDFDLDQSEIIHAANPGKHRVERYSADGPLLGKFGRFDGVDPAGFSGCCNPTGIALLPDGGYVVSEKAPPRIKAYDASGQLLAHWGGEFIDPMCKNLDLAVDSAGRILVLDPIRMQISVFEPIGTPRAPIHAANGGTKP